MYTLVNGDHYYRFNRLLEGEITEFAKMFLDNSDRPRVITAMNGASSVWQ